MKRTVLTLAAACLLLTAVSAPARAGDEVHKIVIRQSCEGDDCDQQRMIFLGEDGQITEVEADQGHSWISAAHPEGLLRRMHHWVESGGFLGVQLTDLTPELRSHFGAPEEAGVMVASIVEQSAAEAAGLAVGDIITSVDGEAVASASELSHMVRRHEAGEAVELEVWSGNAFRAVTATLGEPPAPQGLHRARVLKLDCDGDERECADRLHHGFELDCEGDDCGIDIECSDGECTCEVNGELRDCAEIEGVHVLPG